MTNQQNRAGQSTREMAATRYKKRVSFVVITFGAVLLILLAATNAKSIGIGGIAVLGLWITARLVLNYSEAKTLTMQKEEKRAIWGAKGEEKVGSILESLGDEYLVIHDVVSPYGNIDHIVISKENGIFLLETKAHGGKVSVNDGHLLVNGHATEKDFIAQTLNNTYWLRHQMRGLIETEVWISPVIFFTNAFVERTGPIQGVTILNKKFLLSFLQRRTAKSQNLALWENREKLLRSLCR